MFLCAFHARRTDAVKMDPEESLVAEIMES